MGVHRLATGVELIIGIPGAGKSFLSVREVCRIVEEERRPVYTNLPLHKRVMRKYLLGRGGRELAGLLVVMKKAHFLAFLQRVSLYQNERERLWEECEDKGVPFYEGGFDRDFCERHGPHVISGKGANWIPATAVLFIDEVHHWFPSTARHGVARAALEPEELTTYVTMLRHHCHRLLVMSQNEMQFSITLRRLAKSVWRVSSAGDIKVAWGIRLKHLGVGGILVEAWDPSVEGTTGENARPQWSKLVFHHLPWERKYFRLYKSHTHAGSQRRLERQLRTAREASGLTQKGLTEKQAEAHRKREALKRRERSMGFRVMRWARRGATVVALLGTFALGYAIGPKVEAAVAEADTASDLVWLEVKGHGKDYVRLGANGEQRVKVGDVSENGVLADVDPRKRRVLWMRDGFLWRQQHGAAAVKVASTADFAREFRARVFNARLDSGQRVEPGVPSASVEPPESLGRVVGSPAD